MSSAGLPLIGAHVPARGGVHNAVAAGVAIGADLIQTHPTPARTWRPLRLDPAILSLYRESFAASGLRGHHLHAVYLVNLGSPRPELLHASISSLVHHMEIAASLDADSVVFHAGSHLGAGLDAVLGQIGAALREVLAASPPGRARLLVENSAGSGGTIGRSFTELGRILHAAGSDRLGVCLDTQHAFASGYDLRSDEGVEGMLGELAREVGLDRLHLVHANDSRTGLGSNADRHANVGEGELGLAAFRRLLGDPRLRRVPWVLEVPGSRREGPDREQVALLKSLRQRRRRGAP